MKLLALLSVLLFSLASHSAEFRRGTMDYNHVSGTRLVYETIPTTPTEYIVPLSDQVDADLKNLSKHECIIITGSRNDEIIYARSIRSCNK